MSSSKAIKAKDREIARLKAQLVEKEGEDARGGMAGIALVATKEFSGPLPEPEMLANYERAVPGSSAVILGEFSKEGDSRRATQSAYSAALTGEQSARHQAVRRGQWMAFVLCLGLIALAFYAVANNMQWVGVSAVVGVIGQIATSLIRSNPSRPDRGEKKDDGP
jgi:uncharacterized membrane protein